MKLPKIGPFNGFRTVEDLRSTYPKTISIARLYCGLYLVSVDPNPVSASDQARKCRQLGHMDWPLSSIQLCSHRITQLNSKYIKNDVQVTSSMWYFPCLLIRWKFTIYARALPKRKTWNIRFHFIFHMVQATSAYCCEIYERLRFLK